MGVKTMKMLVFCVLLLGISCRASNTIAPEGALDGVRHRVLVSTDIGGTDPDDFQSMVHLLLYADVVDLEGLVSSPFGPGRKEHILEVIDAYERDYSNIGSYSKNYPTADELRAITKQGEVLRAPYEGVRSATEGSEWIVKCAFREDSRPLHILVWGGLEDVAQALHDSPEIKSKIRVYWIGGPNKKWGADAYQYIADHHRDLWIIESNSTYRGWFVGGEQSGEWGNEEFVSRHIAGKGALGDFFASKMDHVKMGDTPSVGWVFKGDPSDPSRPSWGGRYTRAWERPFYRIDRMTTQADDMEVFGVLELVVPLGADAPKTPHGVLKVDNQRLIGYAPGDGTMRWRFSPKGVRNYKFQLESDAPGLDGLEGGICAVPPREGLLHSPSDRFPNWWTDTPDPELAVGAHDGAETVSRWREDFLSDFATRMLRCTNPENGHN